MQLVLIQVFNIFNNNKASGKPIFKFKIECECYIDKTLEKL